MLALALLAALLVPASDSDASSRVRVHGRVTDVRGLPVGEGEIQALPDVASHCTFRGLFVGLEPLATVRGGATFEIDVQTPCELVYRREGTTTVLTALIRSAADAALEQEIVITRAAARPWLWGGPRLAGTVVDEDGQPLRDVRVRLRTPPSFDARFLNTDRTRQRWLVVPDAVTGDEDMFHQAKGARDGDFSLPALGIPGAAIEAEVDGQFLASISAPSEAAEGLRIVVRREHVRGRVRSADGTPAVGACVRLGYEYVQTDADGRFSLSPGAMVRRGTSFGVSLPGHEPIEMPDFGDRFREGQVPGELELRVVASGPEARARAEPEAEEAARKAAAELVPEGESRDPVAPLVRGRVVTRAGEPIENVMLQFECAGGRAESVWKYATTDADGRFEVRDLERHATRVSLLPGWTSEVAPWDGRRLVLDGRDEVTLVMSRSVQVVFERVRADIDADRVAFVDGDGRRLPVLVDLPRASWENLRGPQGPYDTVRLIDNQSYGAHVPGEATHVCVLAGTRELARVPLRFDAPATAFGRVRVTW